MPSGPAAGALAPAAHRAVEAVWRIESARLIAALARRTGDVALAEDLAQDALLLALEKWPAEGVPANPAAWLMAAAKRRAIDQLRRRPMLDRAHQRIGAELDARAAEADEALVASLDDPVGDERLGLMLLTCHPVLAPEARVALTLRLVGGLTTEEIARAFLVPVATVAQRIVRAKRTLAEARVPFEVPRGDAIAARIDPVLQVLYLVFNEGYAATAGDDWMRPALCEEAMRLGRVLVALAPDSSEAHGLVALMELQASRLRARTDADGAAILLMDQDRARWDRLLIGRGLAALGRAERLARDAGRPLGAYALQAAIAACHARALAARDTDWVRIVALYDALVEVVPSPVVALNRAVAVSMAFGPAAGLALLDELAEEAGAALRDYPHFAAARGDLLARLGETEAARAEFTRAAALTQNAREREVLARRAASP